MMPLLLCGLVMLFGAKASCSEDYLSKMAQLYVAGQTLSPAVFRFEPFILAVEARDMQAAQAFLQTARQAGFRESGATASGAAPQRVMVGIRCSIRLEVSVAGRRTGSEGSRCTQKTISALTGGAYKQSAACLSEKS